MKNPYQTHPNFTDLDRTLSVAVSALPALSAAVHANAIEKGFYDPPPSLATMSLNTIGEICEHWESFRKKTLKDPCDKSPAMLEMFGETLTNEEEELADQFIRILDVAAHYEIDIVKAIRIKHAYNRLRPYKHGGKEA